MADLMDIDVGSEVANLQSGALADWPAWDFCLSYNSAPYMPIKLAAPSPDAAAVTMNQLVARLNAIAPGLGYQPLFGWTSGSC
jgi:hypothetical protein